MVVQTLNAGHPKFHFTHKVLNVPRRRANLRLVLLWHNL